MAGSSNNRMNLLRNKWQEVRLSMGVHTQNESPSLIFSQKRPLESSNPVALQYREDNYRNVTKSMFDLAINQTIETANTIDAEIRIGSTLQSYLDKYKLFDGYKIVNLKEWVINFVGAYRQTDPNSLVVVLPKHKTQPLNPSYEYDLPNFDLVVNEPLETITWLVPSSDIEYIDDYEFEFKAGEWIIDDKGNTSTYYFHLSKDAITLRYPIKGKDKVELVDYAYYNLAPYELLSYPAFIIGGKAITWSDKNGEIYTYYVSDFDGASKIADLVIGQMSDLQIVENRFTFPEKWIMHKDCTAGCFADDDGVFRVDGHKCNTCGGFGYIADTTPLGIHVLKEEDRTENGDIKAPVGFITPDTAILQHSADRVEHYMNLTMRELGLLSQNTTNQSGESKRYDMMQKVTLISAVVTDIYRLYGNILEVTAKYIGDKDIVQITLPEDLDVKNADDLKDELSDAKTSDLPYPALIELTKRYMLAKFGKNQINKKKVDFMALYDKLFVNGIKDSTQTVALFGSDLTAKDKLFHLMAWQMLDDIDNILELSYEDIYSVISEKLDTMLPTPTQSISQIATNAFNI